MAIEDDYRYTDYLDDVSFIAGTEYTIYFPIYDTNGNLLSTNASSAVWVLSYYGQPEDAILQKNATIYDTNTYMVTLNEEDTLGLGNTYLQQIRIVDSSGKVIRPAQGRVIIRKAIPIA